MKKESGKRHKETENHMLPPELITIIYTMDRTYHDLMKKQILPTLRYKHYYTPTNGILCLRENPYTGHCQVFNVVTGDLSLDYYSFSNSFPSFEYKKHKKIAYHYDGKIISITHYMGKKKHGESIVYFENGNKRSHENYEEGKLHGLTYYYYDNGNLFNEGLYCHGVRRAMTLYHKDGSLRSHQQHQHQHQQQKRKK